LYQFDYLLYISDIATFLNQRIDLKGNLLKTSFFQYLQMFFDTNTHKGLYTGIIRSTIDFISYSDYHNLLKNSTNWFRLANILLIHYLS